MIENIFPTPVSFITISNDNDLLTKNILSLLKEKNDPLRSAVDGYRIDIDQSIVDNHNLALGNILEKIQVEIVEYCKQLEIYNQKIVSSWININPKHAYNRKHVHSNSGVSGAYYVSVPDDSHGNFIFHRSREFADYRWNQLSKTDSKDLKSFISYPPKTGDLILFPSYLEHEVMPNQSEDPRISISFNTDYM